MEQRVRDLLHPDYPRQALSGWTEEPAEPELISEVMNFVYTCELQGQERILRLTHSSHRTTDQVRGELEWIDFLHRHGVSVCGPLGSAGEWVKVLPAADGYFVAAVFEQAEGARVRTDDPELWNARLFRSWGRTLGQMHALTPRYRPSDPAIRRPAWDEDDLLLNADRYLPRTDGVARQRLADCLAELRSLPRPSDGYGLVHRDFHQGNFRAVDGRITLFDFDDCAYFWFAGDLAMPPYYAVWGVPRSEPERRGETVRAMLAPLLDGYREANRLHPDWLRQLPLFWKLRDLELYIFCHQQFDMDHLTEGQERLFRPLSAAVRAGDPAIPLDLDDPQEGT